MAANIFGRYVWLVDILRRRKELTFQQINELWMDSGLSYGEGDELPLRTFHNHRKAIFDIFGIDIQCDTKKKYTYFIDNPEDLEDNSFYNWLIDSYATLNHVMADENSSKLRNRIQYENIPSGHKFLTAIIEAMRKDSVIEITHQGFDKDCTNTFEIEPYAVKVFNRRWYVIARSPYYDKVLTYGLDRILAINTTDRNFKMPDNFDINEYFDGCCGIINDKKIPIERVVVKTYANARKYLATLPLHSSQKEIDSDDESITYEYHVRPTYDLLQSILCQADQIEVLEPQWVRDEMQRLAEEILFNYKK